MCPICASGSRQGSDDAERVSNGETFHPRELFQDLDVAIAASSDNMDRLAAALSDLDARILGLASGDQWHLITEHGRLDVLTLPAYLGSFGDMRARAHDVPLGIAHRDDLLRMKRASGRPQDHADVQLLESLEDES
jgi:hypothetical protein